MGTVWIAEHLVLETHVVVKLMTKQVAGHPEGATRFAREAAIAAAVKSPHVVQVFDSGVTADGVAYIVMELLEGRDLGADLVTNGRMEPAEVAVVVAQLVKALATAHRVGVVHRDIKPENVFLCDVEPGEIFVKLLDFGTAKDEQRAPYATVTGQLLGTPYYMSPEQLLGGEIDARADIWSLGVLAFEALTGTRPFEGATVGAITLAIHTQSPRMTDVVPGLPPALDQWFARACARDPAERFPTVRMAGEAFADALKGYALRASVDSALAVPLTRRISVAGRPATRHDRLATSLSATLAPPHREHRLTTWLVSGVFAASVLGMLAFVGYDQPRPAPRLSPSSVAVAPVASPSASPASSAPPAPVTSPAPSTEVVATASSAASTPPVEVTPSPAATAPPVAPVAPVAVTNAPRIAAPKSAPLPSPRAAKTPSPPAPVAPTAAPTAPAPVPRSEPSAAPPSVPDPDPGPSAAPTSTPTPEPESPADLFRDPE
jgi:serine/threonine-protein kinase